MTPREWLDPVGDGGYRSARFIEITLRRHFAEVTLDRDGYLDAARQQGRREQAEPPEALKEAMRRCVGAAQERLLIDGYPGGFFSSAPSSAIWSTIPVPFPLAERAAEALRSAEIDRDLSGLYALAADLEVPVDRWLAPGERQLRRGVDFAGPPSAVLELLRRKARARGLMLNGRAEPGAVWLRPSMTKATAAMIAGSPGLFADFADPALYVGHVDADDAPLRPYVGGRSLSSPIKPTPVEFIGTIRSHAPDRCMCGFPGATTDDDGPEHMKAHIQWSTGVRIPRGMRWHAGRVAVVTATSPISWRKLAYACALLPKRENHYDFASFAIGDGEPADGDTRAYLYRSGDRVIGFASVLDSVHAQRYRGLSGGEWEPIEHPGRGSQRPVVVLVFAAHMWRGNRVGKALIEAVAAHAGVDVAEVAWRTPFSKAGTALALSINPGGEVWVA